MMLQPAERFVKQEFSDLAFSQFYAPAAPSPNVAAAYGCDTTFAGLYRESASSMNTTAASVSASMPPSLPPKRPSEDGVASPTKYVKPEQPEEFSSIVRKRLAASTRTGQACDRCKIRKIRCDALVGGCSPCKQNSTECRTTDRITGRATSRGYVDGLEAQNREFQDRIRDLEQRLMRSGLDTKPTPGYNEARASEYAYQQPAAQPSWPSANGYPPSSHGLPAPQQETNIFRSLPALRTGTCGSNFLGLSTGNSKLSAIRGTALSILGMEIDIADFKSIDMDEPAKESGFQPQLYNKSYQAFLQTALNINPRVGAEKVDLPPRESGMKYAEWYFRMLNPFMPLLHRPTFIKLLTRTYDDPSFRPTTAETVMVHMVFAIMFFQFSARNESLESQADLNNMSNMHYHYSLSMFYQLSCSHTVQDVQALTLICAHLRNFPKPGASWILTQTTMSLAIELGLHRSAKQWASETEPNILDVEMRKRTFWALLAIHVTLSGKLGRPMAFRMEDFDVEMPEPMDDELLSEEGLDTSKRGSCKHEIGLQAIRLIPLFMELYSTIYAVRRRPEEYISTVKSLEAKILAWKHNLPSHLVSGNAGQDQQEGRIFALYAEMWILEFRLLLRHPSVEMTDDEAFRAENMQTCLDCSREMLRIVSQLQAYNSLDTTWYNTAVYVMAITTTLFSQWNKRGEMMAADLSALKTDMGKWLDIMGHVGNLLGSGNRLREAVRVVTDGTLGMLSHTLTSPRAPTYIHGDTPPQDTKPPQQRSTSANAYANGGPAYSYDNTPHPNNSTPTTYAPEPQMTHQQTPYPSATQYSSYSEPSSSTIAYTPHDSSQVYPDYAHHNTTDEAPLLAGFALAASQAPNSWARHPVSGASAWQQWTNTMAGHLEPQDRYSASALMQLGGREMANASPGTHEVGTSARMQVNDLHAAVDMDQAGFVGGEHAGMGMTWPLNVFDIGQGAGH